MLDLFFYFLCAMMLGLAIVTVLSRNLFRSALGLLGVLLCTAVLFLMLRAELVALVQVMVYIGGIMIFVLYAVLLTSELGGRMASPSPLKSVLALVASVAAMWLLAGLAQKAGPGTASMTVTATETLGASVNIASMKSMGERLLDPRGFLVPFELISVLLLAAMVGAIAVARQAATPEGKGPAAGVDTVATGPEGGAA